MNGGEATEGKDIDGLAEETRGLIVEPSDGCDIEENVFDWAVGSGNGVLFEVVVAMPDFNCSFVIDSGGVTFTSTVLASFVGGFVVVTTSFSTMQDSNNFRAELNAAAFSLKAFRVTSGEVVEIKGRGLADEK